MLLLIGPSYQGKLAWTREVLGVPEEEICFCSRQSPELDLSRRVICGFHLWVRALLEAGRNPVQELREGYADRLADKVILCDDIGGGIVPIDRMDRLWREALGRSLRLLTPRCDAVIEFCCGIPRALKGELPR